jgi:hypothetical protein
MHAGTPSSVMSKVFFDGALAIRHPSKYERLIKRPVDGEWDNRKQRDEGSEMRNAAREYLVLYIDC